MSTDGRGTKCRRNIAENFDRLRRVHERYRRQTNVRQTDRQTGKRQTDGRQHIANVLTFSKNNKRTFLIKLHIENAVLSMTSMLYQAV